MNHTSWGSYIGKHDGAATTLSHSENLDTTSYIPVQPAGGAANGGALFTSATSTNPDAQAQQCFLWNLPSANPTPNNLNKNIGNGLSLANARPSSNHPGGVVVTYCDSHTSFISDSIDYQVYARLMSSWGDQSQPPGTQTNPPFDPTKNLYLKFQTRDTANGNVLPPLNETSVPTN
jgi:hypothetical protein